MARKPQNNRDQVFKLSSIRVPSLRREYIILSDEEDINWTPCLSWASTRWAKEAVHPTDPPAPTDKCLWKRHHLALWPFSSVSRIKTVLLKLCLSIEIKKNPQRAVQWTKNLVQWIQVRKRYINDQHDSEERSLAQATLLRTGWPPSGRPLLSPRLRNGPFTRLLCENASQRPVSYICGYAGRIQLSSPSLCRDVSPETLGLHGWSTHGPEGNLGWTPGTWRKSGGGGTRPAARARGLEGLEEAPPGGQGGAVDPQPQALLPRLTCMLGTKPFLILQQFLFIFSKNCSSSL